MAQKVILTDDMEDAEVEADAGTVRFSFDGAGYEIDLSRANKARLIDTLGPWVARARRTSGGNPKAPKAKAGRRTPTGSGLSAEELQARRKWARRNGHQVSDRGRLPADVLLAFEQAHAKADEPKAPRRTKEPAEPVAG